MRFRENRGHRLKNLLSMAAAGLLLATDVADYLATRGMPFRRAHELVAFADVGAANHANGSVLEAAHGRTVSMFTPALEPLGEGHTLSLPDELRDDTGIIFASAFPGLEEMTGERTRLSVALTR